MHFFTASQNDNGAVAAPAFNHAGDVFGRDLDDDADVARRHGPGKILRFAQNDSRTGTASEFSPCR